MRYFLILLYLTITCGSIEAQVISYSIDSEFNSGDAISHGKVSDIVYTSNNTILVMGMFGYPSPIDNGAFYSENGQLLDGIRIAGSYALEYRNRYLQYGYGLRMFTEEHLYSGFSFEFAKPAYTHFLPDKALDILVLPDDNILVAGRFATDSILITEGLRQLCLIDSTGAPIPGFPMIHSAQPIDAEIFSIDSLSDGKYIIAGAFEEVNGYQYKNLARLNADFSVDTTFSNQLNSVIAITLLIDTHDRIWLGCGGPCNFLSKPDSILHYTRLLPSGEPDSLFDGPELHSLVGVNEDILYGMSPYTILEDDDGTFIFGGNFVYANGDYHKTILKVEDDGSIIDEAFANLGADSAIWGDWVPPLGHIISTQISKILKLPDGKLLIGGRFSYFGGEPYNCLVRLKPDGFVGLTEKPIQSKLILYPNPSNNQVSIKLPSDIQKVEQVFVYDLKGVLVKEISLNGLLEMDISDLQKGIYVLQVYANSTRYTEKLIKY